MATTVEITDKGIKCFMDVRYKKDGDFFIWYIPAFNLHFATKSKEDGEANAQAMVHAFFKHNKSIEKLAYELLKLGFKPENNVGGIVNIKNSANILNKIFESRYRVPEAYNNYSSLNAEMQTVFA